MPNRVYAPLKGKHDIRLLELAPARRRATPLRCSIHVVSLLHHPSYEAISWEWGQTNDTEAISIDGVLCSIPPNLALALREYRYPDNPRLLWADAICINQGDLHERSYQVTIMGRIYSSAVAVRVWLGPTVSATDAEILPMFERLGTTDCTLRQLLHQQLTGEFRSDLTIDEFEELYKIEGSYDGDTEPYPVLTYLVHSLGNLFDLGWWTRLWVLQEVVLAQKVEFTWGSTVIDLSHLLKACERLEEELESTFYTLGVIVGHNELESLTALFSQHVKSIPYFQSLHVRLRTTDWVSRKRELYGILLEILTTTRYREATDGRDKIYGLLGILPAEMARDIEPSYMKSVDELFYDVACLILESTQSFMLFSFIIDEEFGWYPEWSRSWDHHEDIKARLNQLELFSASSGERWQIRLSPGKQIYTKGIRIDRIVQVVIISRDRFDRRDAYSTFTFIHRLQKPLVGVLADTPDISPASQLLNEAKSLRYPDGTSADEATYKLALNDCVPLDENGGLKRAEAQDWQLLGQFYEKLSELDEEGLMKAVEIGTPWLSEPLHFRTGCKANVMDTLSSRSVGRDLFVTELGYIGLAAEENLETDDQVWILAGASHPVVLRPQSKKDNAYQAVSEAYLQGVMDGEVIRGSCPVNSKDGGAEHIRKQCSQGRREWPIPEWREICIEKR